MSETDPEDTRAGKRQIVVGVFDDRSSDVVSAAVQYARAFDAELTCLFVEPRSYAIGETPGGAIYAADLERDEPPVFPKDLAEDISKAIADNGGSLVWHPVVREGTPVVELSRLAEETNALMFVLGTRKTGIADSMREFFNGSVVAQLTHRQKRPVVVIPLTVTERGEKLPWELADMA